MDIVFGNLDNNGGGYGGGQFPVDPFGDNQFPGNPFTGREDQLPLLDDEVLGVGYDLEVVVHEPLLADDGVLGVGDDPEVLLHQAPLADDGVLGVGDDPEVLLHQAPLADNVNVAVGDDPEVVQHQAPLADNVNVAVVNEVPIAHDTIGYAIHNYTFDDLQAELAKARDPTLTGFLDAKKYFAFSKNAAALHIREIDPRKLRERILCEHPVKTKYRDGISYLEGTTSGDYQTYTLPNGEKFTSKSRYTSAIGGAGMYTERRVYKFHKNKHVILHYLELPNEGASEALLAKSAPPPPPPPPTTTLNDLATSLEAFRAETNAKLDTMSAEIGRLSRSLTG